MKIYLLLITHFQRGEEGRLRDADIANVAHFLFTLFLLFQQFAFAAGVTAVAFGGHIFTHGRNAFRAR